MSHAASRGLFAVQKLLGVSVLALALVFAGTWFGIANAEPLPVSGQSYKPAREASCNPRTFRQRWTLLSKYRAPRITHISTFQMEPRGRKTVTSWARRTSQLSVAAKFNVSGTVSTAGISKIVSEASAEMGLALEGAGSKTTTKSVKIVRTVSNPTNRNAKFVSFQGWTRAWGGFRHTFCQQVWVKESTHYYYAVRSYNGKWRSYGMKTDGILRCGAGTANLGATGRLALKMGCPS